MTGRLHGETAAEFEAAGRSLGGGPSQATRDEQRAQLVSGRATLRPKRVILAFSALLLGALLVALAWASARP